MRLFFCFLFSFCEFILGAFSFFVLLFAITCCLTTETAFCPLILGVGEGAFPDVNFDSGGARAVTNSRTQLLGRLLATSGGFICVSDLCVKGLDPVVSVVFC